MKKISNLLIAFGVLILLGTAGASDAGSIEFVKIINQLLLGIVLLLAGNIVKKISLIASSVKKHTKVRSLPYFGEVK